MKLTKIAAVIALLTHLGSFCVGASDALEMPATTPTEQDRQVLEALLLRLLKDVDFDMTKAPISGASIVLHTRTPEFISSSARNQIESELEGRKFSPELLSNLLKRNTPPAQKQGEYDAIAASYTNLTFAAGIVVTNVHVFRKSGREFDWFEKAQPKARGWIEAYLPGYSKNGAVAMVRARTGPWVHGAALTAVLEKSGTVWKVKWYKVAFYA